MITFWNRHEVYAGFDLSRFNAILNLLAMEKIKYRYRRVNFAPMSRNMPSIGIRRDYQFMHYVYVHKKDAETAKHLIHQHLR